MTKRENAKEEEEKNKELTQMTKSQRKTKIRSFEMSKEQSLVPQRHGQWLDATKQNIASPQEEATSSTPLAKLKTPEKLLDPPEEAKAQHI
jgi:hypothetical protein